jgi:Tol biopolymer transport system component
MRNQSIVLMFLLAVAAALTLTSPVEARRWRFGDEYLFTVDRVCQDGAQVRMGLPGITDESVTFVQSLTARLYDNPAFPLDNGPNLSLTAEAYGPLLQVPADVEGVYHATPIEADTGFGDPFIIHIYGGTTIRWARLLPVGTTVIVHRAFGTYDNPVVEDCLLGGLAVAVGREAVIDAGTLPLDRRMSYPADTVYRLDAPPGNGSLLLRGTPLTTASTFTQEDVDSGVLRYQHDGTNVVNDSFAFSVSGLSRVSVSSEGVVGDGDSRNPSINADGCWVVFNSDASSLVSGDTNGVSDIFLHDRCAGTTQRVSVSSAGAQANDSSYSPAVAARGDLVAFETEASNLTSVGVGAHLQIVARSLRRGETTHISAGLTGPVFEPVLVPGNGMSASPVVSGDGRSVTYMSRSSNLTDGDSNAAFDVFQRSCCFAEATNARISVTGSGGELSGHSLAPSVSYDGNLVAYQSNAPELVGTSPTISQIFVHQQDTARGSIVSVRSFGAPANDSAFGPSISPDGRYVAFASAATNLVAVDTNQASDIFVHDRETSQTTRVSVASDGTEANWNSYSPMVGPGGRFVVYASEATNLVPSDTNAVMDVFLHDRDTDRDGVFDEPGAIQTIRVSTAADGSQANEMSYSPVISYDGAYVAFTSRASNLAPGDDSDTLDVFVRYVGYSSRIDITVRGLSFEQQPYAYLPYMVRP